MKGSKKYLEDFIIGGAVVVVALVLASELGPVWGGIFAGLPVRLGTTIGIEGMSKDAAFVEKMARGALLGFAANFSFMIALIFSLERMGIYQSFLVAAGACIACAGIIGLLRR